MSSDEHYWPTRTTRSSARVYFEHRDRRQGKPMRAPSPCSEAGYFTSRITTGSRRSREGAPLRTALAAQPARVRLHWHSEDAVADGGRRTAAGAVLTALLVLGALLWLARPEAPPSADRSVPEPPSRAAPPPIAAVEEAQPPSAPAEPDVPFAPSTSHEEALSAVAEAMGAGVVRCHIPPSLPAELRLPFSRQVQRGREVVAMVTEPEGVGLVRGQPPDMELAHGDPDALAELMEAAMEPRGTVVWGDAWPGTEGWCTFEPPRTVTLSGRVVRHPDSDPERELWVNGCGSGSAPVAADGTFEKVVPAGGRCRLEVNTTGFEGTWVVPQADREGLVLEEAPPEDGSLKMTRLLETQLAELERFEGMADPLDHALDAELSAEARAVVAEWRDEARAEVERKRAFYEMAAEHFSSNPDP